MKATTPRLFISLSGIARLAHVQRPVVSMWRSRAAASELPFPSPVAQDRGSDVFDALQVAEWLQITNRGNNPDVVADAAAFARFDATSRGDDESFHALTALVALRAVTDKPIGAMTADELRDLADESDPDDASILSEIEGLGDELASMARFVDVLVDGAYTASAGFEALLGERFRDGRRVLTRTALEPAATDLVSELAVELARSNPHTNPNGPIFVDPTGACGDVLIAVLKAVPESVDAVAMTAHTDGPGARLLRRRLAAHQMTHISLAVSDSGEFTANGAPVHVAQFPTPESPVMSAEQILSAIENVALQLDDAQRAVVLAPASVLTDGRLTTEADALRSQILRSGSLRAIVRLPRGLVTGSPRQALALWVFGPAHESVARADKWTLVADVGDETLTSTTRGDLVSDLVAAMGGASAIRAHAFRFARPMRTTALLASSGSLVATTKRVLTSPRMVTPERGRLAGAEFPALLDTIIATLGAAAPAGLDTISVNAAPMVLPEVALGSLAANRHVRCLSGARVSTDHVNAETGFAVIGVEELTGAYPVGSRRIDRLLLANAYPSAGLTLPGDVVFRAGTQPQALVDVEGASVVLYPARILRIKETDSAGLVAELLAADIPQQSSRDWKRWVVRRVVHTERAGLAATLRSVAAEREAAAERMRMLTTLEETIAGGVVAGTLTTQNTTTTGSDAAIIASSEGSD
ncbi:MAG: hypothetical protein ACKVI4_12700 [Actinomycetales bacterium]